MATIKIVLTSADTELGRETISQLVARGHQVTGIVQNAKSNKKLRENGVSYIEADLASVDELKKALLAAQPDIVLNLTPQIANTLLHDGHNWKGFDETLPSTTTALLEALQATKIKLLVHASYAFLYGNTTNSTESTSRTVPSDDPIFQAAIEAEDKITNSNIPNCLLRMGFLYGPQSEDLKKYETSFKLHRPYYAGPEDHLANFLHYEDAAKALVLVAEQQPVGKVFNVVDGMPAPFADFIDTFALRLGKSKPGHIPLFTAPVAQIIIKPQQMELLDLSTTVKNDLICQQLGWQPSYASYQEGLEQTIATWRHQGVID